MIRAWSWAAVPTARRWRSQPRQTAASTRRPFVKQAASTVGGGGGGTPELAVAGGRDVTRIDEALGVAATALGLDGQAP